MTPRRARWKIRKRNEKFECSILRTHLQDRVRGPEAHEGLALVDEAISTPNLLPHFGASPNVARQRFWTGGCSAQMQQPRIRDVNL